MLAEDFTDKKTGRVVDIGNDLVAFIPDQLPEGFPVSHKIQSANEDALLALGELRAIIPTLPRPELVTQPFLTREAVLSSKIEGTRTQIGQLYLFEASEQDKDVIDPDESEEQLDAREVRNYLVALKFGFQQLEHRALSNSLLKEMHRALLQHVRGMDKSPGEFRKNQAYIGNLDIRFARYVAAPAYEIDLSMDLLETYICRAISGCTPRLVSLALVHYQFEAIHPFADGNGRLGRLLISLMLSQLRILDQPLLYLSAYFESNRTKYGQLLWEVSRDGAWEEWILFFLDGIKTQAIDAVQRARGLLRYREECRQRLQGNRASANDLAILDYLFIRPAITVKMATGYLEITYAAANKLVDRLVKQDILSEATGNERNRIFVAHDIIKQVQ